MLDALRARFRESTAARLLEMDALVTRLERDASDAEALDALGRHFHGLAGLGATYGFPSVSTVADEGEAVAIPLSRSQGVPSAQEIARWRELIASIHREMQGEGEPNAGIANIPHAAADFHVLLVEDDADLVACLEPILRGEGMYVETRTTRTSALDALDERMPDAVIVDVILPDGSGYDVVEALRDMPGGDDAGAIVISVRGGFVDKLRAIRVGADAFADKPLDIPNLVRRLQLFRDRKYRPPERIFLVEDDPTQVVIIQRILESAGYEFAICDHPAKFEEMLHAFVPDLVLLDVQLPGGVNGYDLARYLRQSERFTTVPILFVTGEREADAVNRGVRSGGDDYLLKPVDPSRLLSSIASRLERAGAVRALTERDPLTGLLTRSTFETRARQSARGALVVLDIDHFKEVNDTHGHATGDRVLVSLGTLLRRGLRQSDFAARLGGEEFGLLIDVADVDDAVRLTQRLLDDFAALDQGGFRVTFSAGVAPVTSSLEASLAAADAAMYEAKRSGRGRVALAPMW